MGQFIRHPINIPLEYRLASDGTLSDGRSEGTFCLGLCFESEESVRRGSRLHISIPLGEQPFEGNGVVEWCRPSGGRYEIAVRFGDAETGYRMRMAEQVCHIEQYRREHRELSRDAAAKEWITRFAADFPSPPPC